MALASSHPLRVPLTSPVRESLLFSKSGRRRRELGQKPKVMLIVPSHTRFEEPAPVASAFEEIGLKTFETMKRAGTPIGLLRIGTSAQRAGYEVRIIDSQDFIATHAPKRLASEWDGTRYFGAASRASSSLALEHAALTPLSAMWASCRLQLCKPLIVRHGTDEV